jgi:hypothetical protein
MNNTLELSIVLKKIDDLATKGALCDDYVASASLFLAAAELLTDDVDYPEIINNLSPDCLRTMLATFLLAMHDALESSLVLPATDTNKV